MYDRYHVPAPRFIPAADAQQQKKYQKKQPPEDLSGGLRHMFSQLSSLLPGNMDTEGLLLLAVLLLLYLDSKDEDFLIFLAVMLFSA